MLSLAQAQGTGPQVSPRGFGPAVAGPGPTLPGTMLLGFHAAVLISAKNRKKMNFQVKYDMYMYVCIYVHACVCFHVCMHVCSGLTCIPPQIHL